MRIHHIPAFRAAPSIIHAVDLPFQAESASPEFDLVLESEA